LLRVRADRPTSAIFPDVATDPKEGQIMVNRISRTWLLGGWITVLALVVTVSFAMAASLSTTMLLVALGVAPAIVIALLKNGAASPTVAEILHAVDAKDSRR
jgi:hypothetical protein